MLGVELGDRHRCIRCRRVICRGIFRAQFQLAFLVLGRGRQTVDSQTQVRQYIVIDDVVQKDGVGIERFLGQDDAVVKSRILADGDTPGVFVGSTLLMVR